MLAMCSFVACFGGSSSTQDQPTPQGRCKLAKTTNSELSLICAPLRLCVCYCSSDSCYARSTTLYVKGCAEAMVVWRRTALTATV